MYECSSTIKMMRQDSGSSESLPKALVLGAYYLEWGDNTHRTATTISDPSVHGLQEMKTNKRHPIYDITLKQIYPPKN